jgi:hypothetical protein
MTQLVREACLKPQFAELYPTVPPNVWMPAAKLARQVFLHILSAGTAVRLPERVLNDEHFEFRGGRPGAGAAQRSTREHPFERQAWRERTYER